MKALVFHKPKDIRYETVPDPKIIHSRDAIVRVTSTSICGSDLHIYNGYFPQPKPMVLGHEFMGIIEEVGPRVSTLKRGDRVVVPFPIACGQCYFCGKDLPGQCERSNPKHYGPDGGLATEKGGALFGYTDLYGAYQGGQAELVRVPFADYGPRKVPDELSDEQALFLSDIIPTGWCGAEWAGVKQGDTVAVLGTGPVGLMAIKCAILQGAARVIAVDILPYRLEAAMKAGAVIINASADEAVDALRDLTEGRGPDSCIDCVGMEAHHTAWESAGNLLTAQVGSIKTLKAAMRGVRRGGAVSILGLYGTDAHFPVGQLFDKGLNIKGGQAIVHPRIDMLLSLVREGKLTAADIVTHRMKLSEGPRAYKMFNEKSDGMIKTILTP